MNKVMCFILGWGFMFLAQAETNALPVKVIDHLEVNRYLGTWYEISKFPNWFQKNCIGNTQAEYSLKENGNILVVNTCKDQAGESIRAVGEARQIGAADSPKLKVRFAPEWLSLFPFVWGDYWVIDLDDKYRVAAVSDSKREYLWILSRTQKLSEKSYKELIQRLKDQQYQVEKLALTNQD